MSCSLGSFPSVGSPPSFHSAFQTGRWEHDRCGRGACGGKHGGKRTESALSLCNVGQRSPAASVEYLIKKEILGLLETCSTHPLEWRRYIEAVRSVQPPRSERGSQFLMAHPSISSGLRRVKSYLHVYAHPPDGPSYATRVPRPSSHLDTWLMPRTIPSIARCQALFGRPRGGLEPGFGRGPCCTATSRRSPRLSQS